MSFVVPLKTKKEKESTKQPKSLVASTPYVNREQPKVKKGKKTPTKKQHSNALLVGVGRKENDNEFECSADRYNLGDLFSNTQ